MSEIASLHAYLHLGKRVHVHTHEWMHAFNISNMNVTLSSNLIS